MKYDAKLLLYSLLFLSLVTIFSLTVPIKIEYLQISPKSVTANYPFRGVIYVDTTKHHVSTKLSCDLWLGDTSRNSVPVKKVNFLAWSELRLVSE